MKEDALVAAIRALVEPPIGRSIVLGIGDDAAVWQPSRSHRSVVTSDMLVEGVHFTRALMTLEDAGWRAMTANASDVAAMGARPVLATVSLGMPEGTSEADVRELYRGIAGSSRAAGLNVVGGDLSRAPALTIAITAVGEVRASNVKTRAGGRPGAVLAVTGALGAARAGLDAASGRIAIEGALAERALRAFRRPLARCAEGRYLGASANVQAMMDLSDGLSTDLDRLCAASGCGASLENVPVAEAARAAAATAGSDPEHYALAGGEDFELLVAIAPRAFGHLAARFRERFGRELLRVGTLRAQPGIEFRGERIERTGWEHFAT
ncbi:MAG TPA: thiamine-phosphate kinase [Candidatus Tumulicola sp.]|nr:thiamine-phosphate kinase [Candidatus Tumulicola sp.]